MGFEPMVIGIAKTYVFDHFTTAPPVQLTLRVGNSSRDTLSLTMENR